MPTIECMHERMQPEHDYCPDCGKTQTAESRAIRTLRARAERAEAERDGLRVRITALEDEKNAYIDYVGDALGQDHDGESLWDAAQRVLSDRDRVKALAVRWLRKWQTDMNPTPEMLEQTHALIGAALGERTEGGQ